MVMEDHLLEKDFEKVSNKLSKINEEMENPFLIRNRLEIVKDFVNKKADEFSLIAKKNYHTKMASKLDKV